MISRFRFLLVVTLLCAPLTGCLALGLANRGASEENTRSFPLELDPVDLPRTAAHEGHNGHELDPGEHGSIIPAPYRTIFPEDGWIHGFDLEVTDARGREVPPEMLHHFKVMAPERRELFSDLSLRVAAAGSETRHITLPLQVGYPISAGDSLLVTAMLHNPTDEPFHGVRVKVRLHYTPRGPWRSPAEVVPFFTHVTPPLEETTYDLPPGLSERSIEVRPAVSGTILGLGGHLHRYGVSVRLEDMTTDRVLWETKATGAADGTMLEIPHEVFVWSGGIDLRTDRTYRVTATYDNPTGHTIPSGGMGTLGGVILPDDAWPEVDRQAAVYRWDLEREAGQKSFRPAHREETESGTADDADVGHHHGRDDHGSEDRGDVDHGEDHHEEEKAHGPRGTGP